MTSALLITGFFLPGFAIAGNDNSFRNNVFYTLFLAQLQDIFILTENPFVAKTEIV